MKRYNPRHIADNLRSLDDPMASPDAFDPTLPAAAEFPNAEELDRVLGGIEDHVHIGHVPPGTRFRFFKRLIHRALRIITAPQMNVNVNTAHALRIIAANQQDHRAALQGLESRIGEALALIQSDHAGAIEAIDQVRREIATRVDDLRSSQRRMLVQFQSIAPSAADSASPQSPLSAADAADRAADVAYQLYEESWRGSSAEIQARQQEYLDLLRPWLESAPSCPVLDIGFGRGEFLSLLQQAGFAACGVDINAAFVDQARESGLDVERDDAAQYLARKADDSYSAVVAFQVVEHLDPDALGRLLSLVRAKLVPGGVALFETLNPGVFSAWRWYLMDASHRRFIPPEALRFAAECAGFEHIETRLLHPMAEDERLRETGDGEQRENIRRLNDILFGPQDYAILLRKPRPQA